MIFCKNCGTTLDDRARFCIECGNAIIKNGKKSNGDFISKKEGLVKNSHDKIFKDTFRVPTNAKSFMKNYLPENVLGVTDLETLEICKDSFIGNDLQEFYSDMLYKADINGSSGYIYFLFEHKSYYEKWIHLQLLEYMIKIWRQDIKNNNPEKLPVIIPMVLYHGKSKWKADIRFSSLFMDKSEEMKEFLPEFKFVLYDLKKWSDEEIKGSVMIRAVFLLFKYIFRPELREKLPDIFSLFKNLEESRTGLQYFESLIRYLLSNTEVEINELKSMATDAIDENKGDFIMTVAERLIQEGMQKGIQQGLHQGIQKGLHQGMKQGLHQGIQQGLHEGMQKGIQQGISLVMAVFDKFGQTSTSRIIVSMIKNIYDSDTLNQLEKKLEKTDSVEEFKETVFKLSK